MNVDINEHESIQQYISSDTFVAILQFTVNVGYLTMILNHTLKWESNGPYLAVKRPLSCSQTAIILQSNGPYPAVKLPLSCSQTALILQLSGTSVDKRFIWECS